MVCSGEYVSSIACTEVNDFGICGEGVDEIGDLFPWYFSCFIKAFSDGVPGFDGLLNIDAGHLINSIFFIERVISCGLFNGLGWWLERLI